MLRELSPSVELDVVPSYPKHHTRHRSHSNPLVRSMLKVAVWLHFGDDVFALPDHHGGTKRTQATSLISL